MGKNKTIIGEERTIILKVLKYFEDEKRQKKTILPLKQALKRTCMATGVSLRTVNRLKTEEKMIKATESAPSTSNGVTKLPTPGIKRKPYKNRMRIDDSMINGIRNIYKSFSDRKEVPSIRKVLAIAKADLNFPGERSTMRKILIEKLGCRFKNSAKQRRVSTLKKEFPEVPLDFNIAIIKEEIPAVKEEVLLAHYIP